LVGGNADVTGEVVEGRDAVEREYAGLFRDNPGLTVELTLKPDGHFTWTVTINSNTRSFKGQYTAGSGLLTLVSEQGPAIVGRVTGVDNGFEFKLIGSGPSDPGLTFSR
jgi:hypothetical protein